MFEFFSNLFNSSSNYIFKNEKEKNVSKNDNTNLLAELISKTKLIIEIEFWCEEFNKYYYMHYDWPRYGRGFVLKESEISKDKDGLYIDNGSNTYLFQKIIDLCPKFDKFTITVRNEIETVNGRKKAYEREPIEFDEWKIVEPIIQNKYFAVANYTYERLM